MNNFRASPVESNDTFLWHKLIAGDEDAFSMVFEKYFNSMVNYGRTLTLSSEKVKDYVHDVFVDIWLYRHSLDKDVVVKAYLLSCVRKRIARMYERDHIFRHTTSLDNLDFHLDFSIEYDLISDETNALEIKKLNTLINNLSDRQKEVIYLRYYQGLSIEQVSEILGINQQSVKNLLHRTILHLRKEWKYARSVLLFLSLLEIV